MPTDGARPAVFVDRDGTVIREREYLADPEGVELLPRAAEGLRTLAAAGYAIVIVSNQSGIARGLYDEADYRAVQRRTLQLLAEEGVHVLDSYHCPHHPELTGACDCRKPAPGLFRRAAREHGIDLAGSIFVGDRLRDVLPASALGGLPVLVRTGYGAVEAEDAPPEVVVRADLAGAAEAVLSRSEDVDTTGNSG